MVVVRDAARGLLLGEAVADVAVAEWSPLAQSKGMNARSAPWPAANSYASRTRGAAATMKCGSVCWPEVARVTDAGATFECSRHPPDRQQPSNPEACPMTAIAPKGRERAADLRGTPAPLWPLIGTSPHHVAGYDCSWSCPFVRFMVAPEQARRMHRAAYLRPYPRVERRVPDVAPWQAVRRPNGGLKGGRPHVPPARRACIRWSGDGKDEDGRNGRGRSSAQHELTELDRRLLTDMGGLPLGSPFWCWRTAWETARTTSSPAWSCCATPASCATTSPRSSTRRRWATPPASLRCAFRKAPGGGSRIVNAHPGVSHNYRRDHAFNCGSRSPCRPGSDVRLHVDTLLALAGAESAAAAGGPALQDRCVAGCHRRARDGRAVAASHTGGHSEDGAPKVPR